MLDIVEGSTDGDLSYVVSYLKEKSVHSTLRPRFEEAATAIEGFDAAFVGDPQALARMIAFFRRHPIDVLHAHTVYAQLCGRLFRRLGMVRRMVSTYHMIADAWHPNGAIRRFERKTRPLEDVRVAVSRGVERSLRADGESWRTIHNGIDAEAYRRRVHAADGRGILADHGLPEEGPTFVNVGRFVPRKAPGDMIEAMDRVVDRLPRASLLVVGGGRLEADLRRAVRRRDLGGNVAILDRVPTIEEYLSIADAFVQSSHRGEGLPLVLLEAMAAELPVVATAIPGVDEAVADGETGLLVPPDDPDRLATAMTRVVTEPDADRFGAAGFRRVADRFGLDRMVRSYEGIYRSLLDEGRRER